MLDKLRFKSLRGKILSGHVVNLVLVSGIILFALLRIHTLVERIEWVTHTHEVISETRLIQKLMVDLETGERGFIITGREDFLEPYTNAQRRYHIAAQRLMTLVSDNPDQVQEIKNIDSLITKWIDTVAIPYIDERKAVNRGASDMESLVNKVAQAKGKSIVDAIREQTNAFIAVEEDLLEKRASAAAMETFKVILVVGGGAVVVIVIGITSSLITARSISSQVGGEPEEIANFTEQIARGSFDIEIDDPNPTGILASVISMSKSLQEQRANLKDLNENLEEKVQKRTKDLKSSNERLEQFAYAASHDLREPLRTISGFAVLLKKKMKDPSEEIQKYLDFMDEAAVRMSSLIEDLLIYSRVGRVGEAEMVDLNDLFRLVLNDMALLTAETDATIECDKLPTIWSNKASMSHIFFNLVSNALKYRSEKKPHVQVKCTAKAGCWEFIVIDNGVGIDPKYHDKIFGLFTRLGTRDGTGAGLAIAKKSVETQGGNMWIESAKGIGSKFYFTIPLTGDTKNDKSAVS